MKTLVFCLVIFISAQYTIAQPYTWYSAGAGNWTTAATWINPGAGYDYPQTTDDIVIIDNAFSVTLNIDGITIQSLTLTNSAGSYGSLVIDNPNTLTTTGNVSILPGQFSTFSILNVQGPSGALIVGDGVEDNLTVSGGVVNLTGGGDIFIRGYFKFTDGKIALSGPVNLNVSTAGVRNDNTESNISFGQNAEVELGSGVDLAIVLENGNLGSAAEVSLENYTTSGEGSQIFAFLNNANATTDYTVSTNFTALLPISSDISTGNSLILENLNYDPLTIPDILIESGSFTLVSTAELTVTNNFTSNSSDNFTIDGSLTVGGTLALNGNPNDIDGDGIVQAATYNFGDPPNDVSTIFAVQPQNGAKSAASNWFGNADDNWFNSSNWHKSPTSNRPVVIHADYNRGNWPRINNAEKANARSIDLNGNGANLIVESELQVHESGNSGRNGFVIVGNQSDIEVGAGGDMIIDTDLDIENGATMTVNNGGSVIIDRDADVNPGGSLTVTGNNSSVTIGQ
jgi:hypothetical protein